MKRSTKCILKSLATQCAIAILIVSGVITLITSINWGAGQMSNAIAADSQSNTPLAGVLSLIGILTIGGIGFYYGTVKPCLIAEEEHKKEV